MKPIHERQSLTNKQIDIKVNKHYQNAQKKLFNLSRKRKGRVEVLDKQIHGKTRKEKREFNLQTQTNTQNERKEKVERSDKHAEREKRKN